MPRQDNRTNARRDDSRERDRSRQAARSRRRYDDYDDYDEDEYYRRENEVSRKARNGCLIAVLAVLLLLAIAAGIP